MKKITLYIILIVLIAVAAHSQPDACKNDKNSQECKTALNDIARTDHGAYSIFLKDDPSLASANPDAYKLAVISNPKIINENKKAFENYASAEAIPGKLVGGLTYNAATGNFVTNSNPLTEFNLYRLKNMGATGFVIDASGKLIIEFGEGKKTEITGGSYDNKKNAWIGQDTKIIK